MIRLALALLLAALATAAPAQDAAVSATARQVLSSLQPPSFQTNREHCGLIGVDAGGRIVATRARQGDAEGCTPRDAAGMVEVVASVHTHAAFDARYDSEVPSSDDVLGDMAEGIDGFVATPGGRFWFIDGARGEARLICGLGCLPADPRFRPGAWGPVAGRYTLSDLRRREGG